MGEDMRLKLACVTGCLLLAAQGAQAQFSSTITATSDYDFRGVSLSAKDPALQASVDYAFPNGFAIGAWASNIDYGDEFDGDLELDLYANYTGEINDSTSWTAGIVWYLYPGSDDSATQFKILDYPEIFFGLNFGDLGLKQWYTNDYSGSDESAWYTEANYAFELPQNFSLTLHAGYSYGDAFDLADAEYFDYGVTLGYAAGNFNLGLKIVGTDIDGAEDDVFNAEDRIIFNVSTTLPWGDE
jgi:uncharacterized protein (TIGR02001 family)